MYYQNGIYEDNRIWNINIENTLTPDTNECVTANIVISCVGLLSNKKIPKFKHMEQFKGKMFHSSEWDHTYSFKNKKVGVIGTGPTGTQVIPSLAKIAEIDKLHVFLVNVLNMYNIIYDIQTLPY